MQTVGIIAEYNPFHKGHAYQIEEAKKAANADFAVVAMSGNFVQRGAPAIIDKYTRTKMALEGGADLVLELPVPFATAAAPIFAEAGVSLLTRLGCVDALCFGSESGNIDSLITAAHTLQEEPPEYKVLLQRFLKEGNSYPKSVQLAMNSMGNLLTASPNDTLGVEYIKALLASGSTMKPFAVKREGNDYHDTKLSLGFASASAIRSQIECESASSISSLSAFLPETSFSLMEKAFSHTFPITEDDFSLALGMIINAGKMTNGMNLLHAAEMTPELYDRIQRILCTGQAFTFSELAQNLKTKNITRARINRALLHCLLSISQDDMELFRAYDFCYMHAFLVLRVMLLHF